MVAELLLLGKHKSFHIIASITGTKMKTAIGYITVVQEERFRLQTDSGESLLLTLAKNASVGLDTLHGFLQNHIRVTLTYDGEPNLESGRAYSIREV